MAEINLRAYVKEIDNLVEQEQLDEAIAHCRHIMEQYPKHIETYRVLGKAYLEAKRYGDAADIFQRVLSAIPDDFVAHIGMAIVREDEGNLDAAIWHIERAFETNPANPAIQQELRRLIGRRDGLEPHKVRMTRGALSRMYAHGDLYPQAIAELISALKDDPERPDLQVLLATMYWRSDQHAEAAEICSRILEKLPFCREANRIMTASLQEDQKTDEASIYHRRLAALDPYAAFVEMANIDPQTVDANTVRLEKKSWRSGEPMPEAEHDQPDWATSLGVELGGEPPEEREIVEKPSWLEDLEKPAEPGKAAPVAEKEMVVEEPMVSAEPAADGEIPGWMREAGWREATGEAVDRPISFSADELSMLETDQTPDEGELTPPEAEQPADKKEELAPADIPGWLQDIAPSEPVIAAPEISMETPEGISAVDGELSDWLGEFDDAIGETQAEIEQPSVAEPELPQEEIAVEF
ncbi:MAG: tetratricopeptide repeat protein, partial [Anaerolineales bacterium]